MTRTLIRTSRRAQRGVSVITAVFMLLLFALLAGLMANLISTSHTTSAEDVLGSRAYQAARGGIEWGLYQVMDPLNATATAAGADLPTCFAPAAPTGLEATVAVSCEAFPAGGGLYEEGTKRIRVYRLVSTATLPGPGGLTIERRLEITAEKCRDTVSTAAPFDCW